MTGHGKITRNSTIHSFIASASPACAQTHKTLIDICMGDTDRKMSALRMHASVRVQSTDHAFKCVCALQGRTATPRSALTLCDNTFDRSSRCTHATACQRASSNIKKANVVAAGFQHTNSLIHSRIQLLSSQASPYGRGWTG